MAPNPHSQLWRWEVAALLGVSMTDTPPPHPTGGQLWYESDTGSLFVYYTDPDSSQWVQVTGGDTSFYDPVNGGLLFPAVQIDNPNPNALDDYEEGDWTPVLSAGTGAITSYTAVGSYTKIGRQVFIQMDATITNNGTGAGSLTVAGLPFLPAANSSGGGREVAVAGVWVAASISSGSASMSLLKYDNGYPAATNWQLRISANYRA